MRIFTAAVLIFTLASLTLTGCVQMQAVAIHPKSGVLMLDSTDVLYVQKLLAEVAKDHGLEAQKLVSPDMIASYEGGDKAPFSTGIALILLWQYTNPSHLELEISGPTPTGATLLSKRIFREVKAKVIAHFGPDRVRDFSRKVVGSI